MDSPVKTYHFETVVYKYVAPGVPEAARSESGYGHKTWDGISRCMVAGVLEPSYFEMFLEILGALKALAAVFAFMRSQRHMNTHVRNHMFSLRCCSRASDPPASKVEGVGIFATNVPLTKVLLYQ